MKKIHCEYNENEAGMHTMAILDYLIPTSREYINKTWEKKTIRTYDNVCLWIILENTLCLTCICRTIESRPTYSLYYN